MKVGSIRRMVKFFLGSLRMDGGMVISCVSMSMDKGRYLLLSSRGLEGILSGSPTKKMMNGRFTYAGI